MKKKLGVENNTKSLQSTIAGNERRERMKKKTSRSKAKQGDMQIAGGMMMRLEIEMGWGAGSGAERMGDGLKCGV